MVVTAAAEFITVVGEAQVASAGTVVVCAEEEASALAFGAPWGRPKANWARRSWEARKSGDLGKTMFDRLAISNP
jgi:hypothetical protein